MRTGFELYRFSFHTLPESVAASTTGGGMAAAVAGKRCISSPCLVASSLLDLAKASVHEVHVRT